MQIYMSKYNIVGNHMSRLICMYRFNGCHNITLLHMESAKGGSLSVVTS